ncbi:Endonuclease 4 [Posidoniimonas polymericola]|uniref:Probable endonuclease 4 n=2 Tax=Posidoniimonas polymericola TaxID=2528002 RepID=A0A5C5XUZ3_9BACT|nr:Endonuclease 4 [Posidoniimonas polymericola]
MSIAGGYYKAVDAAAAAGCDCVQVFTKNNNQWRAKPISDDDVDRFRGALKSQKIRQPISHASYLINLASPDDELWKKSIDAMVIELQRADLLGIPFVVMHPGSFTTSSEEAGLKRIAKALNEIHKQTPGVGSQVLLENTAGQGSNLGRRFEHLATIIDKCRHPDRMGVCIDTCHTFAAGYPLDTEDEWKATVKELNLVVGLACVQAIHLNDSKKPLGSRVDRHEHIGRGEMGLNPFRHLMNDRRFARKPMYLETPKGEEEGEDLDVINLRTLRGLIEKN